MGVEIVDTRRLPEAQFGKISFSRRPRTQSAWASLHRTDPRTVIVFLSWSGDLSRKVATILHKFLPCMLHEVEVFMSKHDIESGARWSTELSRALDEASFGILCLTSENLTSPWLHFEAGALAKHVDSRTCCLLIGELSYADVLPPLSQFQNRPFSANESKALVRDLNAKISRPLDTQNLDLVFEKWWPDIEQEYYQALKESNEVSQRFQRSERDMLEELIKHARRLAGTGLEAPEERDYGDLLSRPVSFDSLSWYTLWKFPGSEIADHWQRNILRDINIEKYPSLEHLDAVVERAKDAVSAYAREKPRVFQYGTDYITKSLGFVDAGFRRRHPFSVATHRAFERLGALVTKEATPD